MFVDIIITVNDNMENISHSDSCAYRLLLIMVSSEVSADIHVLFPLNMFPLNVLDLCNMDYEHPCALWIMNILVHYGL